MSAKRPYRRHSLQFKIQVCSDVRSGKVGRREALKAHNLSANLMQMWLTQFDRGDRGFAHWLRQLKSPSA